LFALLALHLLVLSALLLLAALLLLSSLLALLAPLLLSALLLLLAALPLFLGMLPLLRGGHFHLGAARRSRWAIRLALRCLAIGATGAARLAAERSFHAPTRSLVGRHDDGLGNSQARMGGKGHRRDSCESVHRDILPQGGFPMGNQPWASKPVPLRAEEAAVSAGLLASMISRRQCFAQRGIARKKS
jgi:hypothetical protein